MLSLHGSYSAGCRCDLCKAAEAEYRRDLKAGKNARAA